jgi:hypothetical protein
VPWASATGVRTTEIFGEEIVATTSSNWLGDVTGRVALLAGFAIGILGVVALLWPGRRSGASRSRGDRRRDRDPGRVRARRRAGGRGARQAPGRARGSSRLGRDELGGRTVRLGGGRAIAAVGGLIAGRALRPRRRPAGEATRPARLPCAWNPIPGLEIAWARTTRILSAPPRWSSGNVFFQACLHAFPQEFAFRPSLRSVGGMDEDLRVFPHPGRESGLGPSGYMGTRRGMFPATTGNAIHRGIPSVDRARPYQTMPRCQTA